jgi:hypothetical protein
MRITLLAPVPDLTHNIDKNAMTNITAQALKAGKGNNNNVKVMKTVSRRNTLSALERTLLSHA